LENGANSSFVNNIVDEDIPVESLLEDPVEQVRQWRDRRNPHIPLPPALYGAERANAAGMDLTDPQVLEPAREAMNAWLATLPLDASSGGEVVEIRNPADHAELVGRISYADDAAIEAALDTAHA